MDSYLDLVLGNAPAEAFREPLDRARREGASRDELTRLDHELRLALRLRSTLDGLRQREQELAALLQSASDLAGLRDLDALLRAIVTRARQLLAADLSWIAMIDRQADEVAVRVSDGHLTAAFESSRVPLGIGLASMVIRRGRPFWARSVLDEGVVAPSLNPVIRDEGVVGIAGVPLLVGGAIAGVLYTGDRRERTFTQREIALLVSLAAHAGVALENARLLDESRAALASLHEAHASLAERTAEVERSAALDARLLELALRGDGEPGGTLAAVARATVAAVGGSVLIADRDGRELAAAGSEADALRAAAPAALAGAADGTMAVVPVGGGDERAGLVLHAPAPGGAPAGSALERCALVTALVRAGERTSATAERELRAELVADLARATPESAPGLARRARLLGVDLDRPHAAVAAALAGRTDRRPTRLLDAELTGLACERDGLLVALVPNASPAAAGERVAAQLLRSTGAAATVGAAGPTAGPLALARSLAEAAATARALVALGREGTTATAAQLGVYGLLLADGGRARAAALVEDALGPLLRHDQRTRGQLVATLDAYFASGGNVAAAARRLPVHVNTMHLRLARIGELLGQDWRERDRAVELNLALRLRRLATELGP